jgi:hypothetical protein
MDTIITTLKTLKQCIELIKDEIKALEDVDDLNLVELPEYLKSIEKMNDSITTLHDLFNPFVPAQHKLRMDYINHIKMNIDDINKILLECKEWHDIIKNWKCCTTSCYTMMKQDSPSEVEEKIKNAFNNIDPMLKDLIELEEDILGSAINIVNPIMKKAWIRGLGIDEINSNQINGTILTETLFIMLKEEEGKLEREEDCKRIIVNFVKYLDLLSGFEPNNSISINEINQYKTTPENSKSIKTFLNINNEPDKEEIIKDIIIDFDKPFTVTYKDNRVIKDPLCTGYGAGFNNDKACEFNLVDSDDIKDLKLYGVDIECNLTDQNFGGTGQTCIRYQINNEKTVLILWVDRNKVPNHIYKFTIGPEQVQIGDTIKIWLFCPSWNGWSVTLNNIKAQAKFI